MSDLNRRSFLKFGSIAALIGTGTGTAALVKPQYARSDIRRAVSHPVADNTKFVVKHKAIWDSMKVKVVPGSFESDNDCEIAISCISNIMLSKYVYKMLAMHDGSDIATAINLLWDRLEPLSAVYHEQVVAFRVLNGYEYEAGWQQRERQDAINRHVHGCITLYSCTDHLPSSQSMPRNPGFEIIK